MSKENKTKKIFRVEKDKNYSVIHNAIFLDKRISWGAKGVLGYALTKPDDWDLYISEVVKNGTDKKEKVSRYFRELRLAGYLDYRKIYEAGKIARTEYIISEKASHSNSIQFISRYMAKKLKPEIEVQEILNQEILSQEKTSLINTDSLPNTDNKLNTDFEKTKYSTLKSKLEVFAITNNLVYDSDIIEDQKAQSKFVSQFGKTNEQIWEQAEKLIPILQDPKSDWWTKQNAFGFKFLRSNWSRIDAWHNANKPQVREFKKPEKPAPTKFSNNDLDSLKEFLA